VVRGEGRLKEWSGPRKGKMIVSGKKGDRGFTKSGQGVFKGVFMGDEVQCGGGASGPWVEGAKG
jgi:hypothetical protein